MTREPTPCESLVKLDRKLSRASSNDAGYKITAEEHAILVGLGFLTMVSEAKTKALEEQARCRRLRVVSTSEGPSGSTSSEEPTASPQVIGGTFGGTTPTLGASNGEVRAQRMFG